MKIYFSPNNDPLLINSLKEMNALYEKLQSFLNSNKKNIIIPANSSGNPEPYDELLMGIEIEKGEGSINLSLTPTRWLKLVGAQHYLEHYIKKFHFKNDEEDSHHHPEYLHIDGYMNKDSMSLIIETESDTEWL